MKKLWIAASVALLGSVSANAADLAVRPYTKAPVYAEPAYNWSGFYAGLNAGYTWSGHANVDLFPTSAAFDRVFAAGRVPHTIGLKREGFIGGGQIGYNWQYTNLLVGLEADIQGVSADNTQKVSIPFMTAHFDTTVSSKLDWLGTVRGRLGILPASTVLLYVTGGLAYGEVDNTVSLFASNTGVSWLGNVNETKLGWTAGGGIEWGFARNWSAKAEYLYYDLGRTTIIATTSANAIDTFGATFDNSGHIVRAGVNYHF